MEEVIADSDTKDLASDARKYWSAEGYMRGGVIRELDCATQSGRLYHELNGIKTKVLATDAFKMYKLPF